MARKLWKDERSAALALDIAHLVLEDAVSALAEVGEPVHVNTKARYLFTVAEAGEVAKFAKPLRCGVAYPFDLLLDDAMQLEIELAERGEVIYQQFRQVHTICEDSDGGLLSGYASVIRDGEDPVLVNFESTVIFDVLRAQRDRPLGQHIRILSQLVRIGTDAVRSHRGSTEFLSAAHRFLLDAIREHRNGGADQTDGAGDRAKHNV